jgi:hypothetical protein
MLADHAANACMAQMEAACRGGSAASFDDQAKSGTWDAARRIGTAKGAASEFWDLIGLPPESGVARES